MEQKLEILEDDPNFKDVVKVRVPSIYGTKGDPLPKRMAKLVRPAAIALQKVYQDVVAAGGHLFISDMFRTFAEQQKAHQDFVTGRKRAFSPPACNSVHESARAIDIDAFDTVIGHRRVRQILNARGWVNIVATLTGSECWHYEFREQKFEDIKNARGYTAMARSMKEAIGNVGGIDRAETEKEKVKFLQDALNKILGLSLAVDGIYGERTKQAVRDFQSRFDLQVDGVAGPVTLNRIREELGQN